MKFEFVALEMAGSEAEWLENFLANILLNQPHLYQCIVIANRQ